MEWVIHGDWFIRNNNQSIESTELHRHINANKVDF